MKSGIFYFAFLLAVASGQLAYGQTDQEKALAKGKEAIQLMDDGKLDESIKLLQEAQKLDPEKFDYPYELALANYLKKDYKTAVKILEKNINHKDATERLYQLLGNSYDMMGKTDKAFEAYDAGLKIFPNSGMIYLEKGNVYWVQKKFGDAIEFYEKGIEVDPKFPSNYYRATLLYCNSDEEVWGMIYGEIFMNLERNSKRTAEISKLLYDTYKSEIKFTSDTSLSVSFCKQMIMDAKAISASGNIKLPFCMVYEPTLMMSQAFDKKMDLDALDKMRIRFAENYFKMGHNKTHPNLLFDYHDQLLKAGHLSAYNHWILMKGDEDGFNKWMAENKTQWDAFVDWFTENKIKIDRSNKFYRGQY